MKGSISSFDAISKDGRIQAEDGHIYTFDIDSFAKDEDRDIVAIGIKAEFNLSEDDNKKCCDLVLIDVHEFNADQIKYSEPSTIEVLEEDYVDGYEIIDKAKYKIVKGDRSIEKAKYRLIDEVKTLGGNVVLKSVVKKDIKHSMGYAFEYYNVYGLPAVIAKVDEKGSLTRRNLTKQLNHERADRLGKMVENQAVGKIVLKIIGAILLFIFTLGFFLTS